MTPGGAQRLARVRYERADGTLETFRQPLIHRDAAGILTLLPAARVREPLRIGGRVALEPGAPIVWLTVPDAWHDVGRFHTAAGTFTGYYTNVLTPPVFSGALEWRTRDLLLDVWMGADGAVAVLDEDEFRRAVGEGVLDVATARRARAEADRIAEAARRGEWPPRAIRRWPLARARDALDGGSGDPAARPRER